jgi:alkylated DNA repair dioxygenase AlkB
MTKPTGLKIYKNLITMTEVEKILTQKEYKPQDESSTILFRYYGNYSAKSAHPAEPWMLEIGAMLFERKYLAEIPNLYRVCDWVGRLSSQFRWHIDNDRHGPEIISICLTDNRAIGFRDPTATDKIYKIELNAGDAYTMTKASRWNWEHRVMPVGRTSEGGKSIIVGYKR